MPDPIRGLSSMSTKALLTELSDALLDRCSLSVRFESAGGVEVARNIRAGARADLAVLSRDAMSDLDADGLLVAGTLTPLFFSDVVAAAPDDEATTAVSAALSTEDDLKALLLGAGRIAYSTGPSGLGLVALIERWGLGEVVAAKLVQAGPGTPVGTLLATGRADLGFQQRSELSEVAGVRVLGPLPGTAAIQSTFSGAVLSRSTSRDAARDVLTFLRSKEAEPTVRAAGLSPTPEGQ